MLLWKGRLQQCWIYIYRNMCLCNGVASKEQAHKASKLCCSWYYG